MNKCIQNNQWLRAALSVADHSSLTCDVDLDLQAAVLVYWHCQPLGDHTTLDCLWHEGPGGHSCVQIGASVTGPALM